MKLSDLTNLFETVCMRVRNDTKECDAVKRKVSTTLSEQVCVWGGAGLLGRKRVSGAHQGKLRLFGTRKGTAKSVNERQEAAESVIHLRLYFWHPRHAWQRNDLAAL